MYDVSGEFIRGFPRLSQASPRGPACGDVLIPRGPRGATSPLPPPVPGLRSIRSPGTGERMDVPGRCEGLALPAAPVPLGAPPPPPPRADAPRPPPRLTPHWKRPRAPGGGGPPPSSLRDPGGFPDAAPGVEIARYTAGPFHFSFFFFAERGGLGGEGGREGDVVDGRERGRRERREQPSACRISLSPGPPFKKKKKGEKREKGERKKKDLFGWGIAA